jgi:hypothetical protein
MKLKEGAVPFFRPDAPVERLEWLARRTKEERKKWQTLPTKSKRQSNAQIVARLRGDIEWRRRKAREELGQRLTVRTRQSFRLLDMFDRLLIKLAEEYKVSLWGVETALRHPQSLGEAYRALSQDSPEDAAKRQRARQLNRMREKRRRETLQAILHVPSVKGKKAEAKGIGLELGEREWFRQPVIRKMCRDLIRVLRRSNMTDGVLTKYVARILNTFFACYGVRLRLTARQVRLRLPKKRTGYTRDVD